MVFEGAIKQVSSQGGVASSNGPGVGPSGSGSTGKKKGSNQSFDFIKDFKSSVKSSCD